jgi:hypothetical protein
MKQCNFFRLNSRTRNQKIKDQCSPERAEFKLGIFPPDHHVTPATPTPTPATPKP